MSAQGDEDEEFGPSVDSSDPEERIAARRLRIQRRIEAAKRCVKIILKWVLKSLISTSCYATLRLGYSISLK